KSRRLFKRGGRPLHPGTSERPARTDPSTVTYEQTTTRPTLAVKSDGRPRAHVPRKPLESLRPRLRLRIPCTPSRAPSLPMRLVISPATRAVTRHTDRGPPKALTAIPNKILQKLGGPANPTRLARNGRHGGLWPVI